MDFLIGAAGNPSPGIVSKIKSFAAAKIFEVECPHLYITGCGNFKSSFYNICEDGRSGYAVSGHGIKYSGSEINFLSKNDWRHLGDDELITLNGHFVYSKWNENEISIYTDPTGIGELSYYRLNDGTILFSTRADMLAKLIGAELDFKIFGSRWLLFNQISNESIFKNITRLNRGRGLKINLKPFLTENTGVFRLSNIVENDLSFERYSDVLKKLITFPLFAGYSISLGLSGGMDSRVILSYLMNSNCGNWATHTFGNSNHPDCVVAKVISSKFGFPHRLIDLPLPNIDEFIFGFRHYVSKTLVNNSLSSYAHLRNYNYFSEGKEIIIDGGFGEIWRREFFNRLRIFGKNDLLSRNPVKLIKHLLSSRADIFNEEISKLMFDGCTEQIDQMIIQLPDIGKIGIDNCVDLFGINTRLPNYYSYEQRFTDDMFISYMPFVQPVLLNNLINMKIGSRKNAELFKNIIGYNYNSLKKFRMAKSDHYYPFWLNSVPSRLYSRILKKLSLGLYNGHSNETIISYLKEPILDILNSKQTSEAGYYQKSKLAAWSDKLSAGKLSEFDMCEIGWWFSFELFRKELIN